MKLCSVTLALLLVLLTGCTVNGVRRYPIIGFGWVSVSTNQPNAVLTRTTTVGFGMTMLPVCLTVGYGRADVLTVETNNITVEIK